MNIELKESHDVSGALEPNNLMRPLGSMSKMQESNPALDQID